MHRCQSTEVEPPDKENEKDYITYCNVLTQHARRCYGPGFRL